MNKLERMIALSLLAVSTATAQTNLVALVEYVPVKPLSFVVQDNKATEKVKTDADGKKYRLQRCYDLQTQQWQNIGGYVIGNGNEFSFTDSNATSQRAFYRVVKY